MEDGDLFGQPVVLAARIASQARGGEILVSSLVREIVESRGDLVFGPTREVELKGMAGAHRLHPITWGTAEWLILGPWRGRSWISGSPCSGHRRGDPGRPPVTLGGPQQRGCWPRCWPSAGSW